MVRWSEAELAKFLRHGPGGQVTEAAFMAAIRRLAQQYNWMYFHVHNSKRSPEGYPDLTLAKEGQPLIFAELKTASGQLTLAQQAWLATLAATDGIVTAIWRPADLEAIVELLRKGHKNV